MTYMCLNHRKMFEESVLPVLEARHKKSHGTIVCNPNNQARVYRCNHPDVIDVSHAAVQRGRYHYLVIQFANVESGIY